MTTRASERPQRSGPPVGVSTHRAARIVEPGRVELIEVESREPRPGEVRFLVEGCGVCASSLPYWNGRTWFDYPGEPGAPGHEAWGVVEAVGEGVGGVEPGDRVAALSYHGFAERDYAEEGHVVVLPQTLESVPFPGEPLGCAVNVFRRSEIRAGDQVAVVGVGFIGALLVGMAKAAGARVIAISRRATSLEMARRFGADGVIPLTRPAEVVEAVQSVTGGALCERVVEATGKEAALDLAGELTAVRGRLVVAGFHQDGRRSVNVQLWNWRGLDVINAHERAPEAYTRGIREAVVTFCPDVIDPGPLYSHSLTLDEIGIAFALLSERPKGFTKALVRMP